MKQSYSAYILGPDFHIQKRVALLCEDDDEAKRSARKLVDGLDVELWQQGRFIATYRPRQNGPDRVS